MLTYYFLLHSLRTSQDSFLLEKEERKRLGFDCLHYIYIYIFNSDFDNLILFDNQMFNCTQKCRVTCLVWPRPRVAVLAPCLGFSVGFTRSALGASNNIMCCVVLESEIRSVFPSWSPHCTDFGG